MKHKKAVLLTIAITAGCSLHFYTFSTYMQKYLVVSAGFDPSTVSLIMTAALVVFMCLQPVFGMMADRIGSRNSMIAFGLLSCVFVVPLLTGIKTVSNPYEAFALVMAGLLIAAFYTPVTGVLKADLYPATIRALGVGLTYALGNALCGGTAEYVALMLRGAGVESFFYYYVAVMSFITLLAAMLMPDLRKHGYLDGTGTVEENTGLRGNSAYSGARG